MGNHNDLDRYRVNKAGFTREETMKGAANSAAARRKRAEEDTQRVIEYDDGTRLVVKETHSMLWDGRKRTLIDHAILEEPFVMRFDNFTPAIYRKMEQENPSLRNGTDENATVRSSDGRELHGVVRAAILEMRKRARYGTAPDDDGLPSQMVYYPDDLAFMGTVERIELWADVLREEKESRAQVRNRQIVDGMTDVGSMLDGTDGLDTSSLTIGGRPAAEEASTEPDGMVELCDVIERALSVRDDLDRAIYEACIVNDLTLSDVDGCSVSTVSVRLRRLKEYLAERLAEEGYGI